MSKDYYGDILTCEHPGRVFWGTFWVLIKIIFRGKK